MGVLYHKGIRYTGGINQIDDTTTALNKVWSSNKTNSELSKKMSYADNAILGAKNLLPNNLKTVTSRGLTFTHNSDDSITITGTSTAWEQWNINSNFKLPSGTYVMSSDTALTSDMYFTLRDIDASTTVRNLTNAKESTPFTVTDSQNLLLYVGLNAGTYNITVKPMIRLATDTDDTYVPYSMTNREMTPYVKAISNPNLLDNPWFTVNQRGQSSYTTGNGYTVDRWKNGYGDTQCNVSDSGIRLSSTIEGSLYLQYIEESFYNNFIAGREVTLSILLQDGTIYSKTAKAPVNTSSYSSIGQIYIAPDCTVTMVGRTGENEQIQIRFATANADPVSIRAVKLELGSVSTLAMDTAPNYAEELLKCQRYFISFNPLYGTLGNGGATGLKFYDLGAVALNISLPVAMRTKPALSFSDYGRVVYSDGTDFIPSQITVDDVYNNNLRVWTPVTASAGYKTAVWIDYKFTASADL